MSAHTPGPWVHYPEDNIIVSSSDCKIIEWQARSTHVSKEERDSNARLIAAAPDLLEALREIESGTYDKWSEGYRAMQIARAAIAKATGQ